MIEDVDQPPQASTPTEEMKMMKKVLNWCYDHTFINKMRGSKGPKNNLLHYACKEGYFPIVEMLLEENRFEDIDCLGQSGQTPLHEAAFECHYDIVKILVEKGANVNAKTSNGYIPLHYVSPSSRENALKIAKLLIEKGSDVQSKTKSNSTCLQFAAKSNMNCIKMVKLLISNGAFTNSKDPEMVEACYDAVCSGNVEIVKLFIDKGVNINNYKGKIIFGPSILAAAYGGNLEICKLLVQNGANVNEHTFDGETVLHRAVKLRYSCGNRSDYLNVVKFFIEKGVDVNIQNELGKTAIHTIVSSSNDYRKQNKCFEIAKILLENGANVNQQDTIYKETPLHFTKVKEMANILLKNGAKTKIKNVKGETPKDTSKKNKAHEVTKLIVEHENQQRTGQAERNECIICFEPKDGTFAFLPCGHAKTCEKCCKSIMRPANSNPECPTCRQPITIYQKIFI